MLDTLNTCRRVKAALEQGMPGRVAAFNADPDTAVELTVPGSYHVGGAPELSAEAMPLVEIGIPRQSIVGWSTGNREADRTDRLVVGVWAEHDAGDLEQIYEIVAGLAQCALEVLAADGALGTATVQRDRPIEVTHTAVPMTPESRDFARFRTVSVVELPLDAVAVAP